MSEIGKEMTKQLKLDTKAVESVDSENVPAERADEILHKAAGPRIRNPSRYVTAASRRVAQEVGQWPEQQMEHVYADEHAQPEQQMEDGYVEEFEREQEDQAFQQQEWAAPKPAAEEWTGALANESWEAGPTASADWGSGAPGGGEDWSAPTGQGGW